MSKRILLAFALVAAMVFGLTSCGQTASTAFDASKPLEKIKAGFIYVGPVGDYGWSNAHDIGRKMVDDKYDWLETVFAEAVPEGDAMRYIDRFVNEEGCNVIFTTSFGYMDDTVKAAEKYPNVVFMHCSGFKNAANMGTYFSELYQMYYLNGLMAGALTKSGKIGYVGAFPISEVVRHINAYALGAKAANPNASVHVRWINSWYDPGKAREAAEALVAEGIDALAFTEDSPSVIEVAESHTKAGKPVIAFSHYSAMQQFGPSATVSGQLVDWGVQYDKIFNDLHNASWTNADVWWKAKENAALLGGAFGEPINLVFVDPLKAVKIKTADLGDINAYDLVLNRYEAMKAETFEPFTGPIMNQKGEEAIPAGKSATKEELIGINYFVDNVVGEIPAN